MFWDTSTDDFNVGQFFLFFHFFTARPTSKDALESAISESTVATSLASRKTQDFILQDFSRKT